MRDLALRQAEPMLLVKGSYEATMLITGTHIFRA